MRVFITGATGVLGRRVVKRPGENGHQIVKETLGWRPRYATYGQGYRAEIEKWKNANGGADHE